MQSSRMGGRSGGAGKVIAGAPSSLKEPEFPQGCQIYFDAFYDLDSQRPAAFEGYMPIPSLAIFEYCDHLGIAGEQKHIIHIVVRHMDNEYLKIKNAEQKLKTAGGASGAKGNKHQKTTRRPITSSRRGS